MAAQSAVTSISSLESRLEPIQGNHGKIAFAISQRDSLGKAHMEDALWVVNPDGSGLTLLTVHAEYMPQVAFSEDGRFLACTLLVDSLHKDLGQNYDYNAARKLVVMNLEGRVISETPGIYRLEHGWSPVPPLVPQSQIKPEVKIKLDIHGISEGDTISEGIRRIPVNVEIGDIYYHNAALSPDGRRLAFVQHTWGTRYKIFITNFGRKRFGRYEVDPVASGSNTEHDENLRLTWLDNTRFFYQTSKNEHFYVVNVISKERQYLIIPYPVDEFYFSSDKRLLAFQGIGPHYGNNYVVHATPSELQAHQERDANGRIKLPFAGLFGMSEDGRYFVTKELRIVDASGKEYKFLTPEQHASIAKAARLSSEPSLLVFDYFATSIDWAPFQQETK